MVEYSSWRKGWPKHAIDLQSLLGDEADSIVCPDGESFLLLPAQESLRHSEEVQRQAVEMQRTILDAIPAHLAVLDRNGIIIFINESWQAISRASRRALRVRKDRAELHRILRTS